MTYVFLIKEILETRNTRWITALKRLSFCDSIFIAVGGSQKILDLFSVRNEKPGKFEISRSRLNTPRQDSDSIDSIGQRKGNNQLNLSID